MYLADALEELSLNPLDEDLFLAIRQCLAKNLKNHPHLMPLLKYLNDLEAGVASYAEFHDGIAPFLGLEYGDLQVQSGVPGLNQGQENSPFQSKDDQGYGGENVSQELMASFLQEGEAQVQTLTQSLTGLSPARGSQIDWDALYRLTHTLKGSAASIGMKRMANLLHSVEDFLTIQKKDFAAGISSSMALDYFLGCLAKSFLQMREGDQSSVPYELLEKLLDSALLNDSVSPDVMEGTQLFLGKKVDTTQEIIKVPSHRLRRVFSEMERMRELISQSERLLETIRVSSKGAQGTIQQLSDLIAEQRTMSNLIQKNLISMRLVAFRTLFPRLRKVGEDYLNCSEKRATIELAGGMIEIKKGIVDKLSEILIHLLHNALDHGIEAPSERRKSAKDPVGKISLAVEAQRSSIVVSLKDDGRGIDLARVRRKIVEKGFADEEKVQGLSANEIMDYLFLPGFSTSDRVTSISGRGVGMDAVRATVSELAGEVQIESELGKGTTVILRFDADVSVEEVILISAGTQRYGIPVKGVEAIIPLDAGDREDLLRYPYYEARDALIPVYDFREMIDQLQVSQSPEAVILLKGRNQRCGIVVEKVLRKDHVIVSPPPSLYRHTAQIAGIFNGEDGGICAVVEPFDIVTRWCQLRGRNAA